MPPKTGIEFVRSIGPVKLAELYGHNGRYTEADDRRVCELLQVPAAFYYVEVTPNVIKQARHEFGMKSFEKGAEPVTPQPDLFAADDTALAELRRIYGAITALACEVKAIREDMAKAVDDVTEKPEYNLPPMFDVPPFPSTRRKANFTENNA